MQSEGALDFVLRHTLDPPRSRCRLDGTVRIFDLAGQCGVPPSATAGAANLTVTQATAAGFLSVVPGDETAGTATTISFRAGQTRANNAILKLSSDGQASVAVQNGSPGAVHFLLDVSGYFAP